MTRISAGTCDDLAVNPAVEHGVLTDGAAPKAVHTTP
jgi:hypothetical protein